MTEDCVKTYDRVVVGRLYILCHGREILYDGVCLAANGDVVIAASSHSPLNKADSAVVLRTGYRLAGLLDAFSYVEYNPPKEV